MYKEGGNAKHADTPIDTPRVTVHFVRFLFWISVQVITPTTLCALSDIQPRLLGLGSSVRQATSPTTALARAWFDHAVPPTFHGAFAPSERSRADQRPTRVSGPGCRNSPIAALIRRSCAENWQIAMRSGSARARPGIHCREWHRTE